MHTATLPDGRQLSVTVVGEKGQSIISIAVGEGT